MVDSLCAGAWLSLVERMVWDHDVAGSNPVAPTISLVQLNTAFYVPTR